MSWLTLLLTGNLSETSVCLDGACCLIGFTLGWADGEPKLLNLIHRPICQISAHNFSKVAQGRGLLLSLEPFWSISSWLHFLFHFLHLSPSVCFVIQKFVEISCMWLVPVPYYLCLKGHGFIPYCAYRHSFSGILRSKGLRSVCFHQQEVFSFERMSWSYIRRSPLQHFCCSMFGVKDKHGSSWLMAPVNSGLLLLTLRRARADKWSWEMPVFDWSWLMEERTLGRRPGKRRRGWCATRSWKNKFLRRKKSCVKYHGEVK